MVFVCNWCQGGAHSHCLGPACECDYTLETAITPERRRVLRTGAEPQSARESEFQAAYIAHRAAREAADARRR